MKGHMYVLKQLINCEKNIASALVLYSLTKDIELVLSRSYFICDYCDNEFSSLEALVNPANGKLLCKRCFIKMLTKGDTDDGILA